MNIVEQLYNITAITQYLKAHQTHLYVYDHIEDDYRVIFSMHLPTLAIYIIEGKLSTYWLDQSTGEYIHLSIEDILKNNLILPN